MSDVPTLVSLTLAGVPEQVNIPINICLERGIFEKHGVSVTFRLVPEGTGAMLNLLEAGEADLALTVTDAFMVGKANGRKVQLLGTFVESPLVWAVASSAEKEGVASIADLLDDQKRGSEKCLFGISRLGSGSATMAHYMCSLHGKTTDASSYVIAHNFDGLKKGVQTSLFDAFLWETFTTKPSFDRGEVKKIGEVPTPWSAFSFVSGLDLTAEKAAGIKNLFLALAEGCEIFKAEASGTTGESSGQRICCFAGESSEARICREFGHTPEDAKLWLSRCRYAVTPSSPVMAVDLSVTSQSVDILKEVGLIPGEYGVEGLWSGNDVITFKNT